MRHIHYRVHGGDSNGWPSNEADVAGDSLVCWGNRALVIPLRISLVD